MKKIKYFLMSVFLVSLASCNDATDIVQDGELGNDVTFQTVSDLEQYLLGAVYTNVSTSAEIGFTAEFTDECSIGVSNGGQAIDLHRFNLNASTGYPSTIWLQQYLLINRANRLLEAAEKVTPVVDIEENIDETQEYNNILAQARTLRAYAYMQLVSYFSTNPADDSALGVMLLDFVPKVDQKFPRVSNGEIYALIESDLAYASANILSETPAAGYKYVSKSMINAMYARMYLYRKNYPLAKQYAQAVINTSGLTLSAPTVYRQMWADLAGGEIIFAASRPNNGTWGNIAGTFYFNTTDATGGAFLEMGRNLYNLYPANDVRNVAFVDATRVLNPNYLTDPTYLTTDILPIDKYPGKGNTPLRNDLKIFRLSEMYFILAECAANEGDLNGVAGYIKNVRDARFSSAQPLPSYANVTAAWADIMLERRKELAFEGFRYLDIKRLGVLANQSIDRNITDDVILSLPTTIPNTDHRFTLPIPQDEIAASGSIMEQNPNY
ncbi:MAG: RagB/SusD family nutrient uptake outer membrane protein [Flavobacterium sp.]|nr:MAG: RagB/SusD family nutrient uptake outer membrane protein [Flavobacterium sp.]